MRAIFQDSAAGCPVQDSTPVHTGSVRLLHVLNHGISYDAGDHADQRGDHTGLYGDGATLLFPGHASGICMRHDC